MAANWPKGLVDDFIIVKTLGRGSYSSVYEAIHKDTGMKVAIKKEDNIFYDLTDGKRILREIRILRHLAHRNIVKLFDVRAPKDFNPPTVILILELADTDLKVGLKSPGIKLTFEQIQMILYDILKGLHYIHSASVLHRDIKPGNILISKNEKMVICDFGLARTIKMDKSSPVPYWKKIKSTDKIKENPDEPFCLEKELEAEDEKTPLPPLSLPVLEKKLTSYVVTRWYRAPEIILVQTDYGAGIDVWAAGCVFAEILSVEDGPHRLGERKVLFQGSSCYPFSPSRLEKIKSGLSSLPTDQLNVILDVVGTPTEEDCSFVSDPEKLKYLKDKPKKERKDLTAVFPDAKKEALDLLSKMLVFNPHQRLTISECLCHPFFEGIRNIESEIVAPSPIDLGFDDSADFEKPTLMKMFKEDIEHYDKLRKEGKINYSC